MGREYLSVHDMFPERFSYHSLKSLDSAVQILISMLFFFVKQVLNDALFQSTDNYPANTVCFFHIVSHPLYVCKY